MSEHVWATDRCPDCAAKDAEIERLRTQLEEANITIRALVGAPPIQEKP